MLHFAQPTVYLHTLRQHNPMS